jgi:hypothetical protein
MPDILTILARMRQAALRQDAAALDQIIAAYGAAADRLRDALELAIRRMWNPELDSFGKRYIVDRLRSLLRQMEGELVNFSTYMQTTLPGMASQAARLGADDGWRLLRIATPRGTTLVRVVWDRLPREAINAMLAFLSPESALLERIRAMAPVYSGQVSDALIDAIVQGWGPAKTAKNIAPLLSAAQDALTDGLGRALTDSLRMARTAQLYAYRAAAKANYVANSDVVTGWQWSAELDDLTCMSCVAQHGTIHDLSETLDDHHNGRCAPIPVVLNQPLLPEDAGKTWFEEQDEDTQRAMMGPGKFDAWQEGKFDLDALSSQHDDDVYGTMRAETTLGELVGE